MNLHRDPPTRAQGDTVLAVLREDVPGGGPAAAILRCPLAQP